MADNLWGVDLRVSLVFLPAKVTETSTRDTTPMSNELLKVQTSIKTEKISCTKIGYEGEGLSQGVKIEQ